MRVVPNEGNQGTTCYPIGDVNWVLTYITWTCDQGSMVICASDGGYLYSLFDGSYARFERHSNVYELDLWVNTDDAHGSGGQSGFARPGQ